MVFTVFFWERTAYDFDLRKSDEEFVRSIYAIYFMKGQENRVSSCVFIANRSLLIQMNIRFG
jgi:hypothetical protein